MHSVEFLYWLQGFFELESDPELTASRINTIKNHLEMAILTDGPNVDPFCLWLKGYLAAYCQGAASKKQANLIATALERRFDPVAHASLVEKGLL